MITVRDELFNFTYRFFRGWARCDCFGNSLHYIMKGYNSMESNLQMTAFPRPSSLIYLADPVAIKVRLELGLS